MGYNNFFFLVHKQPKVVGSFVTLADYYKCFLFLILGSFIYGILKCFIFLIFQSFVYGNLNERKMYNKLIFY